MTFFFRPTQADLTFLFKLILLVFLNLNCIFVGLIFSEKTYAEEIAKPDSSKSSYKFIVAGHVRGDDHKKEVFNPAFSGVMKDLPLDEFKFIILNGDFVFSGTEEYQNSLKEEVKKYSLPFHFVAGNHETSWDTEGVNTDSRWDRNEYLEVIGEDNTYYSFFQGPDLFLVLDGNDIMNKEHQQVEFVKQVIAKQHRFLFVFVHHILWDKEVKKWANGSSIYSQFFVDEIIPALNNLGEEVYVFAGDVGVNGQTMFHSKFKNINFISSGFGSFGARNNVVIVNVGVNMRFKVEGGVPLNPIFPNASSIEIPSNTLQGQKVSDHVYDFSQNLKAADEILKLREELANSKNRLWLMENSTSWKNTQFLRDIVHYLREKYIWAINHSL
jgi:hypothetical protein